MRTALAFAALLSGCAEKKPTTPVMVSPAALVRAYRDTPQLAERAWTGRTVVCTLAAGTYTRDARTLRFHAQDERAPCVCFVLLEPLASDGTITLTGVCAGAVRDEVQRGAGVAFCVHVTDCRPHPNP
jgi:hypothetical protein